jgi:hypothetical protein
MRHTMWAFAAAAALAAFAAPARADDSLEQRMAAAEQQLAAQSTASAREIQSSVDAYLASAKADATLVGGPGSAGYDGGFWIRGGTFLLKTNLTLQTRYEYFDWNTRSDEARPGGDLSGFSLPRVTLKLSGDATCDVHYYTELEFGHAGSPFGSTGESQAELTDWSSNLIPAQQIAPTTATSEQLFGLCREAWIEYEAAPAFTFRMGLLKTATTRQLMTPPEMQQFVDISMASALIGQTMPGYTDRNRDYGFMLHGVLGCDGEWSYMLTVTNGDGPVHHNVVDGRTDDPLAYSARINWDIIGHAGYEEGALRQTTCGWVAALGAWGHYFVDHQVENPLIHRADRSTWGVDAALGYGGFSFTAAYSAATWDHSDTGSNFDAWSYLIQAGYLFPDTAWEIAARYDAYDLKTKGGGSFEPAGSEWGVAVNYYLDGHADKLTLDASFITADQDGNVLSDVYAGYNGTGNGDAMLLRFQWQLAL